MKYMLNNVKSNQHWISYLLKELATDSTNLQTRLLVHFK